MKRLFAIVLLLVSSTAMADWTLKGTGTAFVVNKDYALTAAHVIEDCDAVSIRYKHKEVEAEVAALDSSNDLGLLLLDKPLEQIAKFRGGKNIRLGATVINYGYPLTGQLSDHAKIARGEINSLAGLGNDSRVFQYDASTQPGNSGGPVLDQSGNVVGVVSHRYTEEPGINFAVKSFVAEAFLSSNGVDYERDEAIEKLETADIAEKAERFTVLVGCWGGSDSAGQTASQPAQTTPSAPEVKTAQLTVTSSPTNADVFIDNEYFGATTLSLTLRLGRRELTVRKNGYETINRSINLQSNQSVRVTLPLIKVTTTPKTTTTPEVKGAELKVVLMNADLSGGANVYIDGRFVGITPLSKLLPLAQHKLRVTAAGYVEYAKTIYLTQDATISVYLRAVQSSSKPTPDTTNPNWEPLGWCVKSGGSDVDSAECPEGTKNNYKGECVPIPGKQVPTESSRQKKTDCLASGGKYYPTKEAADGARNVFSITFKKLTSATISGKHAICIDGKRVQLTYFYQQSAHITLWRGTYDMKVTEGGTCNGRTIWQRLGKYVETDEEFSIGSY